MRKKGPETNTFESCCYTLYSLSGFLVDSQRKINVLHKTSALSVTIIVLKKYCKLIPMSKPEIVANCSLKSVLLISCQLLGFSTSTVDLGTLDKYSSVEIQSAYPLTFLRLPFCVMTHSHLFIQSMWFHVTASIQRGILVRILPLIERAVLYVFIFDPPDTIQGGVVESCCYLPGTSLPLLLVILSHVHLFCMPSL